ncbi:hypothetical protein ISU10_15625 [Nocardioides agariphilus]|jgi:hypothetical protein|uniref:Uncharacterized protein n=1 Tax=Nocardioides agariphilus TaxID=433664 RepID=A0A930YI01_9ACTN|nr:hypothetical protein [Nocardioides agariphilus]MBF4769196.1 hypothetical protein [Nocardioides agariphilus]
MRIPAVLTVLLCLVATGCEDSQPEASASVTSGAGSTSTLSFLVQPRMHPVDATLEVADGFEAEDTWYVVSADHGAFLGLWTADQVDRDACLVPDDDLVTPGPSVQDLADALVSQKATRSTQPEAVVLAGYDGLYLELTGPPDLGVCDERPGLADERGIYVDDQVDQLWILDVDGQRLIVDSSYGPDTAADLRDALGAMVESLEIS